MRTSRPTHFEHMVFCAFAVLAAVLLLANPARAETFCVQTELELQNALDEAESNSEDDTILLVRGTYHSLSSPEGAFYYGTYDPYDLTIEGDWGFISGHCVRRGPPSAANTTIDGDGSKPALYLQALTDFPITVSVKYLTFEDGMSSSDAHVAGGLTIHTGDRVSVIVEANVFSYNQNGGYGGGLNVGTSSRLKVINNRFSYNGAGMAYGAAVLYGNATGSTDPGVEIYNNTVAYNFHTGAGHGGLLIGGSASVCYIDNNIFWGNEEVDIRIENANCTLLRNDIEVLSGTPAWNQDAMSVLPEWVDALMNQFQLRSTSPLVNQGLVRTTNYSMPPYDLDGLPRFSSDSPVDIGAYEVQFLFYDGFDEGNTDGWSVVVPPS